MKIKNHIKKRTLLALFFVSQTLIAITQTCLPSGITFSNQQQIDDFATNYPGCTEITGAVCVGDCTYPFSNSNISNLNGLSQLTKLNSIYIRHNNNLTNLSGLDNVTTITDYLWVGDNSNLSDLTVLSSLTSLGRLRVGTYNAVLTSLTGLEGITSLDGHLTIDNNYAIPNLIGLHNITSIGSNLEIVSNSSLTTLDALQNLTSMGGFNLYIGNNDMLTNLNGLENIDFETIPNLLILDSDNLTDCDLQNICDYLTGGGTSNINYNDEGCNSATEIITACNEGLPVDLIEFNVRKTEQKIQLNWQTASEENNSGFNIQHSTDGRSWMTIDFVEGKGTTSEIQSYTYLDSSPLPGDNYYRLQQIDYDGKYEFSPVRHLMMTSDETLMAVYPNPSKGHITLNLHNPKKQKASIRLFDSTGQLIWEQRFNQSEAVVFWEKEFDLPQRELYFLVSQVGDKVETTKVTIVDEW